MFRKKKQQGPEVRNVKVRPYGQDQYVATYEIVLPHPPKPAKKGRVFIDHTIKDR